MKKLVAITVCLSLLVQCLAQLLVVAGFQWNRVYIAKNLCENRDRPQLKCCGKCYLRKQLKRVDTDGKPSKNSPQKVEKQEVADCLLPPALTLAQPTLYGATAPCRTPGQQHRYDGGITRGVFRPPAPAA